MKKNSLNEIDDDADDDSTDDDLTTIEKLDEYLKLKDDTSADPDYKQQETSSSTDGSSILTEIDSEEEKTESQKKLNGEEVLISKKLFIACAFQRHRRELTSRVMDRSTATLPTWKVAIKVRKK